MQQKTLIAVVAALVVFVAAAAFVSGWNPVKQEGAKTENRAVAAAGDTVSVIYAGRLDDGTLFDTNNESLARSAGVYNQQRQYVPFEFTLGMRKVIVGFDKAVTGMKIGETKKVRIPPEEAYGDQGPLAGKALNFEIKLVSISNLPAE